MFYTLTTQAALFFRASWPVLTRPSKCPLLSLVAGLSLLLGTLPLVTPRALALPVESSAAVTAADGTYLFGESPEVGQVGFTYMILNVQSQQVVGAFYQPSSSFDCFHGHIAGNDMVLMVADSYSQTSHPYTLALEANAQVASQSSTAIDVVPTGFNTLEPSEADRNILSTCLETQML